MLVWIKRDFVCHLRNIHILLLKSLTWHRLSVSHLWEEHCPCRAASDVSKEGFAKADIWKSNFPSSKIYFLYKREHPSFPPFLYGNYSLVDNYGGKNVSFLVPPSIAGLTWPFPVTLPVLVFARCLPNVFLAVTDSLNCSQSFLLLQALEARLHESLEKWH